jgi:hypothetical protein
MMKNVLIPSNIEKTLPLEIIGLIYYYQVVSVLDM